MWSWLPKSDNKSPAKSTANLRTAEMRKKQEDYVVTCHEDLSKITIIDNYPAPDEEKKPIVNTYTVILSDPTFKKPNSTPPPLKNRYTDIFIDLIETQDDKPDYSTPGLPHSFHAVQVVHKRGCQLHIGLRIPKNFVESKENKDSYCLIKENNKIWKLYYIDEENKLLQIDIWLVQDLEKRLLTLTPHDYSIEQYRLINNTIAAFRRDVQRRKTPNFETAYYFKRNPPGSEMSPLEAYYHSIYAYLAAKYGTTARACLNKKGIYEGVASREIRKYKPIRLKPLHEKDLRISVFEKGYKPYKEMRDLEREFRGKLKDKDDEDPLRNIIVERNPLRTCTITVRDLKNYMAVKSATIILASNKAHNEDDTTSNNIGREEEEGELRVIDKDMSKWPFTYKFKGSKYIVDGFIRKPKENQFIVHHEDLRHFPNLIHANPKYWPTKPASAIGDLFSASKNSFTAEDNKVFSSLEFHPVTEYYKYKTWLQYVLFDPNNLRPLLKLDIPESMSDGEEGKAIDKLIKDEIENIQAYKRELLKLPEFYQLLVLYKKELMDEIFAEIAEWNQHYAATVYEKVRIDPNTIQEHFDKFFEEVSNANKNIHHFGRMGSFILVKQQ